MTYRLEKANMRYIYQLTGELIGTSIQKVENEKENLQDILYKLVVSDVIQDAGSLLIEEREGMPVSSTERNRAVSNIVDRIQQEIMTDNSIICANFIEENGGIRVVAAKGYYRLSEAAVREVEQKAEQANGETIFLNDADLTEKDNVLVMAKAVREKKNLTLKNIGTIVLFVDVEKMCSVLTSEHDGIFIVQEQNGMTYVLNGDNIPEIRNITWVSTDKDYCIRKIGGKPYFEVNFKSAGEQTSYTVLTSYERLFSEVRYAFVLYVIMYLLCGMLVAGMSFGLTSKVTKDIRLFIQHIHRIPHENGTELILYEREDILDKDVYELMTAFNNMSVRMNELVADNYQKQLLLKETQIKALQSQMNPHFLYNTLNSVYWMTKTAGVSAAAEMIRSLGILLREAISAEEPMITVERELDIACQYFIIQKYRYKDRLEVEFDMSEDCSQLMIPKFTVQPLAENAISYGLECMLETCTIKTKIYAEGEECICEVWNNGPAPEENLMEKLYRREVQVKGTGVGLMNIDKRVKSIFGEKYGVTVFRKEDYTVARVTMKKIRRGSTDSL